MERLTRRTAGAIILGISAALSSVGATTTTPTGSAPAAPAIRVADAPWTLSAPIAREVVVSSGSRFTVVGGLDAAGTSTAAVVDVDPNSAWPRRPARLALGVHDAAGVRVGRRILVFGGGTGEAGTADVQAVAADGTATTVGTLPAPRADLVAARVGNATYVFGGANGDAILPDILRTTDGVTFTRVGTLPVPVRYPAVAVVGSAIYLFGGVSNSARGIDTPAVQRFDTKRGVVDTVAQLPTSVSHASAVVLRGRGSCSAVTSTTRASATRSCASTPRPVRAPRWARFPRSVRRRRGRRRRTRLPRRRPGRRPRPPCHRHRPHPQMMNLRRRRRTIRSLRRRNVEEGAD